MTKPTPPRNSIQCPDCKGSGYDNRTPVEDRKWRAYGCQTCKGRGWVVPGELPPTWPRYGGGPAK